MTLPAQILGFMGSTVHKQTRHKLSALLPKVEASQLHSLDQCFATSVKYLLQPWLAIYGPVLGLVPCAHHWGCRGVMSGTWGWCGDAFFFYRCS